MMVRNVFRSMIIDFAGTERLAIEEIENVALLALVFGRPRKFEQNLFRLIR